MPQMIRGDQKVRVHLMKNSVYSNNPHTIDDLKTAVTEYIRNVDRAILNSAILNNADRAILNTVFGNSLACR
jgi:hypothetical protein